MSSTFAVALVAVLAVWAAAPSASSRANAAATPPKVEAGVRGAIATAVDDPALKASTFGIRVVDCADGSEIFDQGGATLLNPASNLKLIIAAVSLDVLGPGYRFRTRIMADNPITAGALRGNLYLKGGGDPELVYEKVWKVIKELKALGLERIEGDVVGDDSFFDEDRAIAGWEAGGNDVSRAYYAPLGALSFNFNTVAVVVRPGETAGLPAIISLETPTEYVAFDNQTKTEAKGKGAGIQVLTVPGSSPPRMKVTGSLGLDSAPRRFYRAVPKPTAFALALFMEMLKAEGIQVTGTSRAGKTPESATLIHEIESSSLDIVLKYMNKISSNFIAEQLLKTLAAEQKGAPGTAAKGLELVSDWLSARGIGGEGMKLLNASGLAQGTRIRPRALTDVLLYGYNDPGIRWEFVSSLPIAGVDGTLRRRMRNGPAAGLVRAKTGSIDGVYGMSGYALLSDGRTAAFSMVANDLKGSSSAARRAMDAVIEAMIAPPAEAPVVGPNP